MLTTGSLVPDARLNNAKSANDTHTTMATLVRSGNRRVSRRVAGTVGMWSTTTTLLYLPTCMTFVRTMSVLTNSSMLVLNNCLVVMAVQGSKVSIIVLLVLPASPTYRT